MLRVNGSERQVGVMGLLADAIADAYRAACLDELRAPKPGNVHDFADGHGMTVGDFETAAPT